MKTRQGFVSNSSSSSFVLVSPEQLQKQEDNRAAEQRRKSKMDHFRRTVIQWLWDGKRIEEKHDPLGYWVMDNQTLEVVHYGGCCDYCWGEISRDSLTEFLRECYETEFVISKPEDDDVPPMPQG